MFRNITVNGFVLEVAKVRFGDNGLVISGLTEDGYAIEQEFNFVDGAEISFTVQEVEEVAPVKKARKERKVKAEPEVAEVEELDYEGYKALKSRRGRRTEAQKAALLQAEINHPEWVE